MPIRPPSYDGRPPRGRGRLARAHRRRHRPGKTPARAGDDGLTDSDGLEWPRLDVRIGPRVTVRTT